MKGHFCPPPLCPLEKGQGGQGPPCIPPFRSPCHSYSKCKNIVLLCTDIIWNNLYYLRKVLGIDNVVQKVNSLPHERLHFHPRLQQDKDGV